MTPKRCWLAVFNHKIGLSPKDPARAEFTIEESSIPTNCADHPAA